jgi:hypothetical protein
VPMLRLLFGWVLICTEVGPILSCDFPAPTPKPNDDSADRPRHLRR